MKLSPAFTLLIFSFQALAFERSATVDLSSLEHGFKAGVYKVDVKITAKASPSKAEIRTSQLSDPEDPSSNSCMTFAVFELGELTFTMTDTQSAWTKTVHQKLTGSVEHTVDGKICDLSIESLSQQKSLGSTGIIMGHDLILPVKAPGEFKSAQAWFAVYNTQLSLPAQIATANGQLVIDPSQVLSETVLNQLAQENANQLIWNVSSELGFFNFGDGSAQLK